MKKHASHKFDFAHSKEPLVKTVFSRKMVAILNKNKKMMTHKDGHLMLFYKIRDATLWLNRNKLTDLCQIIRVKIDIIQT